MTTLTAVYHWFAASGVSSVRWDLAKLLAQFVGAVFIAWFAVRLALRRFKSEKGWERQTSTLADLLLAIGEMDRINDRWLTFEMEHREVSLEQQKEMHGDWAKAMRDFENGAAVAAVLLPPDIYAIVKRLRTELKRDLKSWFETIEADGAALGKARDELISAGRKLQAK